MKNRHSSKVFTALVLLPLLAGSLVGCAAPQVKPVATEPDVVSERIAAAAEKAAKALNDISGIEQARTPLPPDTGFVDAPSTMTQIITVKWTGPIEQIVRTLATRAGMGFRVRGAVPAVPLTVNVDAYQQSLIQVLKDVGAQAGRRADLSVDGRTGTIEIRYAPSDR